MGRGTLAFAFALALGLMPARVLAQKIVVGDLYAEPDLRDHAAATTMILRSILGAAKDHVARTDEVAEAMAKISGHPTGAFVWIPLSDGPALLRVMGADALALGSVTREGPVLRATVQVRDTTGALLTARMVSAPGDDVKTLAVKLAEVIGSVTGLSPVAPASTSVGQLRAYAAALRALRRDELEAAELWLSVADPRVAGRVADARVVGRLARERTELALEARLEGALLALDPLALKELTAQPRVRRQAAAVAALARSHLAALDTEAATRTLAKARGRSEALALARAALAHRNGDAEARNEALAPLLTDAPSLAAASFVSRLPSKALPAQLEESALSVALGLDPAHRRLRAALGLRAARGGIDVERALGLVEVAELDARERKQLATLLTGETAALPDGVRLRAELEVSRGKFDAALPLSARTIEAAPDDPRSWALRGRLLLASGEGKAAIEAFRKATEGDARFARELARALVADGQIAAARAILEGLSDEQSAELVRVRGLAVLEAGQPDEAIAALRQATLLDPNDLQSQEALARAYDAAGRTATAVELRDVAAELRSKGLTAEAVVLVEGDSGAKPAALADEQLARLADNEVRELLAAFPSIADGSLKGVAVAPIAVEEAFYKPRHALPDRLEKALRLALQKHYGVRLGELDVGATLSEPLVRQKLVAQASEARVPALLGYRIEADGGAAAVKLTLFDAKTEEATEIAGRIERASYGLVEWNSAFIVGVATLLSILLFWQVFVFLRGTGTVVVKVVLDPGSQSEVFNLVLSRKEQRPDIGNVTEFVQRTRSQGHRESRYGATLVGPTTTFGRLPPGRWFVHLVGVYEKANETRELAADVGTREVRVRRNQTERVELDLVPVAAEYRISVYDGASPVAGAELWLDDNRAAVARTTGAGDCLLHVPIGEHMLSIKANGVTMKKNLSVFDTRVQRLSFNLERERRLAEAVGGIELEGMRSGTSGKEVSVQMQHLTEAELDQRGANAAAATSDTVGWASPGGGGESGGPPAIGTPPPSRAPSANSGLARYRRTAELGRGAMGVVYRAHDIVLERDVALKLISNDIREHPQALELFLREAKALAQLNHSNIVTVFDQGEDDDGAFMVMELVEGDTVESLLENGDGSGVPLGKALDIIDQCAAGLAYAHGKRVIHRDIKPGNMFMSQDGVIKLGDFGLARVVEEMSIRKTEVRGTPLYMAPEQITGTDVDFRADLYALGCTAFELLCGRPPFVEGQVLYHHMHTPPPPLRSLAPTVPEQLEVVVARCIAKDKNERPASADELREQLGPLRRQFC